MKDLLNMFNGGSAPSPAKAPSSRKASFSPAIKEEAAPATPPGKASADRPGMMSREKSTYALRGAAVIRIYLMILTSEALGHPRPERPQHFKTRPRSRHDTNLPYTVEF